MDIKTIFSIEKESFEKPWSLKMFEEEIIDNDKASYFVVEYNTEMIGYAGYWHILDEAHITNIAIRPAYQNMGIGRLILGYLLEVFGNEGIKKASLEVREKNLAALKLYEDAGFRVGGKRKGYYGNGINALIMWKDVNGYDKDKR
jgi:ribosomal-protein-alanine N-acetyltransferase